ncbi:RNA-directed DNA polymerase mobile like protein [Argiope bruennichi]|uniref:RNA-directed DNA polymerase mobile like protein n=1 Tax=Argiope bruennichi TaxID=94029 RepID=A0A8T0EXD5_ARGBR|nr:RNA-directed DNA polymerase mobile like protein [Argiope bruennichi]
MNGGDMEDAGSKRFRADTHDGMIIDNNENESNISEAPDCQICSQRKFTEIAIFGIQMVLDGLNKAMKCWIKNPNLPQDHPTLMDINAKRADAISRLEEAQGNLSTLVCQDENCYEKLEKGPEFVHDHPTYLDMDAKRADAISRLEEAQGDEKLDKEPKPAPRSPYFTGHRCQTSRRHIKTGGSSRNARCVKCGESHSTNSCTKPKDTPAKCCLCGRPHTANYSQCQKNSAMRKSFQASPKDGWNNATALSRVKENFPLQSPVTKLTHPQRGIRNKFKVLKYFPMNWVPDIITIQETHLRPSDNFKIPNYSSYRLLQTDRPRSKLFQLQIDRLTDKGGGSAILVKNSIPHHPTPIFSSSFENTSISIDLSNGMHVSIASIYRLPNGKINTTELHRILSQTSKSFAIGDFNAKHSSWSWSTGHPNSNGTIVHNFIASNYLILMLLWNPPFPIKLILAVSLVLCANIAFWHASSL